MKIPIAKSFVIVSEKTGLLPIQSGELCYFWGVYFFILSIEYLRVMSSYFIPVNVLVGDPVFLTCVATIGELGDGMK